MGTVFLLLRFRPTMSWLATRRLLDRFVTVLNARALTVYLWHNIAIALAVPLADYLGVDNWDWEWFLASLLLTFVAMLAFGWVEDLAARRRPQLLPGGDASGGRSTEPTTADEPAEATGPQR
jgi:peptidoglycan/LPS O-acetylase OafA/YrhL